jgi:hypothetical protein
MKCLDHSRISLVQRKMYDGGDCLLLAIDGEIIPQCVEMKYTATEFGTTVEATFMFHDMVVSDLGDTA